MHLSLVLSRNWEQAALSYSWPPICTYACILAPRPPLTPSGSLVSLGSQFRGPAGLWFSFSSPLAALTQDSSTLWFSLSHNSPTSPRKTRLLRSLVCALFHTHISRCTRGTWTGRSHGHLKSKMARNEHTILLSLLISRYFPRQSGMLQLIQVHKAGNLDIILDSAAPPLF